MTVKTNDKQVADEIGASERGTLEVHVHWGLTRHPAVIQGVLG